MDSVSAIVVAGAPVHSRVSTDVAGGVQRLAQIPPGQFCGSDRHLSVDQRLLEHGGCIQGGTPQLLTLGSRVDVKFFCPQSLSDRLTRCRAHSPRWSASSSRLSAATPLPAALRSRPSATSSPWEASPVGLMS
jgi:hypothetical protein